MIIHRSKPFCVWSPLTTFRHAKHHLQGKNKGQHIQCIFNTAMFNQYRMECNQESMKNEERWKVWYQNFHFILFNIKAHFKTTRHTCILVKLHFHNTLGEPINSPLSEIQLKINWQIQISNDVFQHFPWNSSEPKCMGKDNHAGHRF